MEDKILYPNRTRLAGLTVVCLLGMLLAHGAILSLICGAAACFFATSLLPNATSLTLNSAGFTARALFRDTSYRWQDIEAFVLITRRYLGVIPISRSVGYRFSESYRKMGAARKVYRALVGWDGRLADNYGLKAQNLVAVLETCRGRAALAAPAAFDAAVAQRPAAPAPVPSTNPQAGGQVILNGELVGLAGSGSDPARR